MDTEATPPEEDLLAGFEELLRVADADLDEEERRREREAAARTENLEQQARRIDEALREASPRLLRAGRLEAGGVVARLQQAVEGLKARRAAITEALGYDPAERHRRESAQAAALLIERIGGPGHADALERTTETTLLSLPDLDAEDAKAVVDALQKRLERGRAPVPPALPRIAGLLAQGGENVHAAIAELLREHRRARDVAEDLQRLEEEVGLLETGLGKLPKQAIRARIHELACRAKLLQAENQGRIPADDAIRMRRTIFGRLRGIVRDASCDFVPSLRQEWMPASLEAEIARAQAEFAQATDEAPVAAAGRPDADGAEHMRGRLRQAERWVLAEVYRHSNRRFERPGDEEATKGLRQATLHAIHFLGECKDELPRILRHDADAFGEGSEYRWLRRRFAKLAETGAEEVEGPGEAEETGSVESLAGERIHHPSVLRALPRTRGRRVVMVGGAVREERRGRLASLFEASQWEWIPYERGDGQRGVQHLVERIRNGSMDLLVCLLGFIGHSVSEQVVPAAKERRVPCAIVPRGYGEAAIAEAILALPPTA